MGDVGELRHYRPHGWVPGPPDDHEGDMFLSFVLLAEVSIILWLLIIWLVWRFWPF